MSEFGRELSNLRVKEHLDSEGVKARALAANAERVFIGSTTAKSHGPARMIAQHVRGAAFTDLLIYRAAITEVDAAQATLKAGLVRLPSPVASRAITLKEIPTVASSTSKRTK